MLEGDKPKSLVFLNPPQIFKRTQQIKVSEKQLFLRDELNQTQQY